jgi:hypothetical protein
MSLVAAVKADCDFGVLSYCSDLCDPGLGADFVQAVQLTSSFGDFSCVAKHPNIKVCYLIWR